jgi:hypothetical protein
MLLIGVARCRPSTRCGVTVREVAVGRRARRCCQPTARPPLDRSRLTWRALCGRSGPCRLGRVLYAVKKARAGHLYAIADREVIPEPGEPEVIFCVDEFGPLNLQPHPGRQWAAVGGKNKEPGRKPRPRRRATYARTAGGRHLFAAYELGEDKLYGHIKPRKNRARFLEFCRYLRSLHPPATRIAIICDNFSPPDDQEGQASRAVGRGKQHRDRLHAHEFILVKPHRGAVHRAAVLRARRHRPRHPPGAGQHDPPLHHLAQQPRLRRTAPPGHRPGKRCLIRH